MTTSAPSHRLAYVLLVLTALFWSGNFVLARAMHAAVPPMTLSFMRWLIAFALLAPVQVVVDVLDTGRQEGGLAEQRILLKQAQFACFAVKMIDIYLAPAEG